MRDGEPSQQKTKGAVKMKIEKSKRGHLLQGIVQTGTMYDGYMYQMEITHDSEYALIHKYSTEGKLISILPMATKTLETLGEQWSELKFELAFNSNYDGVDLTDQKVAKTKGAYIQMTQNGNFRIMSKTPYFKTSLREYYGIETFERLVEQWSEFKFSGAFTASV